MQWDRVEEWVPSIKKVSWTSSKNIYKAGAVVRIRSALGGIKGEGEVETTEYIENEKLAWQSIGSVKMSGIRALSPTKTGTRAIVVDEYEMPYSILGKLINRLWFRRSVEKNVETGLKKLKDMVEK